ncbi:Glucan endo-1,3-beta-glucosidase 12 [Acorus calamus]|uniref:Glucan endo-1,3-beta-glucosidase 12 n=1 Tax=Acorus calamus TaxID=4465 RepID=A0AAV9C1P5_ACOCL|nr:Glucan endo-1,3-beta-glucosidase 12 [Acorus calamus]
MRKQVLLLQAFLLIELHLAFAGVHRKDEYTGSTVLAPPSLPEGNTTFVDGATWCVASAGASISDLQVALDWACGSGSADCGPVQNGGPCFEPNTLAAHASFAFNSYYQQNGNSDIACNFGGTARITTHNPMVSVTLEPV